MKKYAKTKKMLFIVVAIMAFLPASNLLAYVWDSSELYIYIDTSGSGYEGYSSGYTGYFPTGTYYDEDEYFEFAYGLYAYTIADVYSEQDPLTGYGEALQQIMLYGQKDWEWSGPPATAPEATVRLNIGLTAAQSSYSECLYVNEADLYAEGQSCAWGIVCAEDSAGSDQILCLMLIEGYADNEGANYWVMYNGSPDYEDWDSEEIGDYYYEALVDPWWYDDDTYYVVSSGIGQFTGYSVGVTGAYSYAEMDYDGGQNAPEAVSEQESFLYFYAYCELYED